MSRKLVSNDERALECRQKLLDVVARLNPLLVPHGFVFEPEHVGIGHLPFANGHYNRGQASIGLVYRYPPHGFGCVVYGWNGGSFISHDGLMDVLRVGEDYKLLFNERTFSSYARNGGDVVDALTADLERIVIPLITTEEDRFARIATLALGM